jgi:hypothetical protein
MSETEHAVQTIQQLEAENAELARHLAAARGMLAFLEQEHSVHKTGTCALYPIADPVDPNKAHIIRGSRQGIDALEITLKQRFQDGVDLGRAQLQDQVEELGKTISMMSTHIRDLELALEVSA